LDSYSQIFTSLYVSNYNNNNKYCIDSCWESGNIYYANYDEGYVKKIQYDGTVIATLNLTNPFMVSVIQNSVAMNSTVTYPPQDDQGCWIAKANGKIIKTDKNLNILYTYSGTANPLCIKADIDGGCLIVDGGSLIKISSTAEIIVTKNYTDFSPVVTSFIDLAVDSGGWIWFCANDKLYNLMYDASLIQLVQQFVIDPLGTDDPFSSSSSEAFSEEEEHLAAIDVDRNVPLIQRYLYVAGGNSYKSFVLKYASGALVDSKQYFDMGFPYVIKVVQGMGSDSLYVLDDSAKWDDYGYGSSSSSTEIRSSSSSSSSSTEIKSSSSSSSTEIRSSSSSSSSP
jgi:hypothetical protein